MLSEINFDKLFKSFSSQKVLVVGDVMLDSYLWGNVDRISPEAPVPIVMINKRENRLGGAANVALNIQSLGGIPIICTLVGDDFRGDDFISLLQQNDLSETGIIRSKERVTTTKFRIFGNKAQMLRVDEETQKELSESEFELLLNKIENIINSNKISCVVFQDYDKGIITKSLLDKLIPKLNELNIPIAVDPKRKNFSFYKNVTLFKPNFKELKEGLKLDINIDDEEVFSQAVNELLDKQNIRIIMATLSEKGVYLSCNSRDRGRFSKLIPAHVRMVADVSGAGDTVIGTAALCLSLGMKAYDIAYISNLAGGMVCEYIGVVPVDKQRLLAELKQSV